MLFCIQPIALFEKITEQGLWLHMICFSLVTTLIPFLSYTIGLSRLEPSKASMTATLEPALAAVFGVLIYQEEVSLHKVLGVLMVLGAVVFLSGAEKTAGS